jgi:hypothetical protein
VEPAGEGMVVVEYDRSSSINRSLLTVNQAERSDDLQDPWVPLGGSFEVTPAVPGQMDQFRYRWTVPATDPAGFFRYRAQ